MKRTALTIAGTVIGLVGVVLVATLIVLHGGGYNVAASEPTAGITRWALETLRRNSVAARADSIRLAVPSDSASVALGFDRFHAMCVQCHGAPGMDRGEAGRGMTPMPPRLEEEAHEWTDAELFWITKHGLRLAGMPAYGATHSDSEIAAIVAFIRYMEEMTEEDYANRVRSRRAGR